MKAYVPITRRFSLVEKQELRDPDYLSIFGYEPAGIYKWPNLLELTPLVILGEGRSGKTREFEKQVEILRQSQNFAFFLPLERLHDESLEEALSKEDFQAFETWKKSPTAVAYFFLDALDELKLREGSLRAAVKKLQLTCEPHFARMKLILSCRPADWQSQIDSQHLEPFCVAQSSSKPISGAIETPELTHQGSDPPFTPIVNTKDILHRLFEKLKRTFSSPASNRNTQKNDDSEAFFLEVISKSEVVQGKSTSKKNVENAELKNLPTIVTLLPLSQSEIREFARSYAPNHADPFCTHLEAHDFWHLYRLPAEIIDALDQMATNVPLGSLEDQLQLSIQRKLREQQPNKRRALSVKKAKQGAERIALALFLLKRRTLKVEESNDPDMLDIGDILTDWTPAEQQELICKTLFDPSGVGTVRFHHRATQEYLAALRLDHLREDGMHERDLFALLFSEVGGEEVIKPSMAPVAAWLALWHPYIRRAVLEREPRLLFSQGLPSALSIDIRAEVLRAYIPQYAGKECCHAGIGHEELRRVVHPSLGSVVRELWNDAYTGHDSRELLLEMIWLGPMPDCSDLAIAAALDDTLVTHHRTYASWGVLAAGTSDQKLALTKAAVNTTLPQQVIRSILPELVPSQINIEEFLILVEALDIVPDSVHGLNHTIYQVIKNQELSREELITLRDRLVEAIWATRRADCRMYQAHSEKDHYQDGLIACCNATIPNDDEDASAWAWSLAIAVHFGERHESIIAKKETEGIWESVDTSSKLREAYFWACLNMADEIEGHENDWPRFIRAVSESKRSIQLKSDDQIWLLKSVVPDTPADRRGIAFQAILYFFDLRQNTKVAEALKACISDREDWLVTLHNVLNPQPRQPDEWDIRNKSIREKRKVKEEKRVADWLKWRVQVLSDTDFLMDGNRRLSVLYDAQKVISQGNSNDSMWGQWDSAIIAKALGNNFLERYRQELSVFWRETEVQLRSEREPQERNSYLNSWLLALAAVKSEAETTGWATLLSQDEAVKAARIACIELNGFGGYIATLDEAHPQAVASVIADEASAQLCQFSTMGRAEVFHDVLYHGTGNMKAAVSERIAPHLSDFSSSDQTGGKDALEYAVRIIAEVGNLDACALAINSLEQQLKIGENLPTGFLLSLLVTLNPETGCRRLLYETEDLNSLESCENAISTFAFVFGDRHSHRAPDLNTIPEDRSVPLLKDLTLRAYQTVRRGDDIEHEGSYSPGVRDKAQGARSFLLDSFLNTKRPETLAAIHHLAEQPEFAHIPNRLRQMAYEIAAQMSDITPYPLAVFQAMDRDRAFVPFDHSSLLTAMTSRLDSFEHDVLYAEDTPIEALRRLDQETDLRRFIANWLRGRDRGVFDFTQEAVVVDEKRTDIRFQPRVMQGYATVELKREAWSVRDLEQALTEQLVGQYLQHERCRTGCLLICQAKTKYWQHPNTKAQMSLQEVVSHLKVIAKEIMAARPELHIAVKGIDYS